MPTPKPNDEVFVRSFGKKGRITSIERGYVHIKFDEGRGRPYKIHVSELKPKKNGSNKLTVGLNFGVFRIEWTTETATPE